jgi:hypothetical protein
MSVALSAETVGAAGEDAGFEVGFEVSLSSLEAEGRIRSGPLDEAHIARLMEVEGRWPPVLVWARPSTGRLPGEGHTDAHSADGERRCWVVLDGAHRLEAARRLGHTSVLATAFEGDPDDAYIEAVRRNVSHGLPLSRPDRLRAGRRILTRHPGWSDRRIGEVCGLSPHSVARLRAELQASTGGRLVHLDSRLGRDGKVRPARPGAVRDQVIEALKANPGGSLREVAAVARVSPETVRRIRREVADLQPDVEEDRPAGTRPLSCDGTQTGGTTVLWREEHLLRSNPELAELAVWLERSDPGESADHRAALVPLSRIYEVADESYRRAAVWTSFARALEARSRARGPLRA